MNRTYKDCYEDIAEGYQEARDYEFAQQLKDFLSEYDEALGSITEDDVTGFMESFDFQDESDWVAGEYESRLGEYEDAKYEAYKDEKMGL